MSKWLLWEGNTYTSTYPLTFGTNYKFLHNMQETQLKARFFFSKHAFKITSPNQTNLIKGVTHTYSFVEQLLVVFMPSMNKENNIVRFKSSRSYYKLMYSSLRCKFCYILLLRVSRHLSNS